MRDLACGLSLLATKAGDQVGCHSHAGMRSALAYTAFTDVLQRPQFTWLHTAPMSTTTESDSGFVGSPNASGGARDFLRTLFELASWNMALVLGLMLLRTVTSSFGLLMLVPMLGVVGLDVQEGSIGYITDFLRDGFSLIGLQPTLLAVLAVYLLIMTVNAALVRWQAVLGTSLEQAVVTKLRKRVYHAIVHSKWLYFSRQRSSDFSHVLTVEIERVGAAVSVLLSLAVKIILTAVYIVLALVLSAVMTSIVAVAGLALSLVLRRKTLMGQQKGSAITEAYGGLYSAVGEHLAGMRISKSLGIEGRQAAAFGRRADGTAEAQIDRARNSASLGFWFEVGSVAILATMLYIALETLALPLASILLLLFLFARLIPMVTGIQKGYENFLNLLPAYVKVMDVYASSDAAAETRFSSAQPLDLERKIELRDVSFWYGSIDDAPVLRDLGLDVRAGRTTAIVGPSGAGKSTVVDLVIGLLVPTQGSIAIDGEPLSPQRLAMWRKQVGYVPQDVFLFHDTVRANLLLVDPDAGDEDLWSALRDAAAAEFISALPEGLDTVLGDRGVRLSGGERQRLSLARALLRRPSLLVLDEATSALDVENEQRIQEAIERLHGRVTILVVAHRLSTVRNADVIHVLENGRLVESGDWDTLVQTSGGRFRELCRAQGLLADGSAAPAAD